MRLTSFIFNAVKSFGEPQNVDVKDLTLVYGANSSGKSSILQTLLLLKQSAGRAYSAESGVVEFRGGSVDLGGFRTFVHNHDTRRSIGIALVLTLEESDEVFGRGNFFDKTVGLNLNFGLLEKNSSEPQVISVVLSDPDGAIAFKYDPKAEGLVLEPSSAAVIVDRYITAMRLADKKEEFSDSDIKWLRNWVRTHSTEQHGWIPYWSPVHARRSRDRTKSQQEVARQQLARDFLYYWYNWVFEFSFDLLRLLHNLVYIGPLRDFPRRVVTEASDAVGLGVRGERLVLTLARRPELVDLVNTAFEDLEIPYVLKVEQVRSEKIQDALGDVAVALLTDSRTGLTVSPADVGFGLSQILPVVVQLVGNTDSLILIEQPEIHLHPKMQSRLADLLITSAIENRNQIIVETHSEHLLFRAQRRLRERSREDFNPKSLGVFFVGSVDGEGNVQELRLGKDGEMIDPWPDGFFDDKLDDLFAGL